MIHNYSFLKKYVGHNDLKGTYFIPLKKEEIDLAEKKIGIRFPDQLKFFYETIGYGILSCGEHYPEMYLNSGGNQILTPIAAAAFYKPLEGDPVREEEGLPISSDDEEYWMSSMAYEIIRPGDLPFFEILDSSSFMVLKPHSEEPNAVWYMGHTKIEDSFEEFIWNLYYVSPNYWESKLSGKINN